MTQAAKLAQLGSPGISTGFKNRIINGAMVIDQRNAGASVTASVAGTVTYTLDRWAYFGSAASKFTVQQNAGAVTPPAGFNNYLGVTSSSAYSVGSGEQFIIRQNIEGYNVADLGWGYSNAKTVTLSFWVRSSLTGTFTGNVCTAAGDRSLVFSYVINSANTWEQKSITIAGDTSGGSSWLTTNGIGITLNFSLGAGSSLNGTANTWNGSYLLSVSGAQSVVGTNGATFYITGVQLEVGTTATDFEYRDYGRELALCQRYFLRIASGAANPISVGFNPTSTGMTTVVAFPVAMRANPTIYQVTGTNYFNYYRVGASDLFNSFSLDISNTTCFAIFNNTEISGSSAGQAGIVLSDNASAYIGAQAEL